MRIAQVAPLAESIPPQLYGGTERVVSWLTEELVALGHEVTLFASADSVTRAKLVGVIPRALRSPDPAPIQLPPSRFCSTRWLRPHPNSTSSTAISIGCTCRFYPGSVDRS
jgi:hypothetical protein